MWFFWFLLTKYIIPKPKDILDTMYTECPGKRWRHLISDLITNEFEIFVINLVSICVSKSSWCMKTFFQLWHGKRHLGGGRGTREEPGKPTAGSHGSQGWIQIHGTRQHTHRLAVHRRREWIQSFRSPPAHSTTHSTSDPASTRFHSHPSPVEIPLIYVTNLIFRLLMYFEVNYLTY